LVRVASAALRGVQLHHRGKGSQLRFGRERHPKANRMGLLPVSGGNPMQFGHQREEGAENAPTAADSFPSMRQ
jgi:hypothetical protein